MPAQRRRRQRRRLSQSRLFPRAFGLIVLAALAAASGHSQALDFLHTRGNQIVDSHDRPVRLSGVNWYGFELTSAVAQGLYAQDYKQILNAIKSNGYNVIRLPFSNRMVEHPIVPPTIKYRHGNNRDLKGLNSLQVLDKLVAYAGQIGLRIMLENHRSSAGDNTENSVWYTAAYPEAHWIGDWKELAWRYRDNAAVMGFDLRNEPNSAGNGGSCWDCAVPAQDWHLAAQRAGNAVLSINPHLLIFVEGTDCYRGDCGWWGSNLQGVRNSPVVLNVPNQVVYSAHDYGPLVHAQPWFGPATNYSNLVSVWTRMWAFVSIEGIAPVWLAEFGNTNDPTHLQGSAPGSQGQWFQSLVAFLDTQPRISWNYWALNGEDAFGLLGPSYDSTPASVVKQRILASIESGEAGRGDAPGLAAPDLFTHPPQQSQISGIIDNMYLLAVSAWPSWWKLAYLAFATLIPAGAYGYLNRRKSLGAAAVWGLAAFVLLVAFELGASSNTKQFLVLFGNSVLGAVSGYLLERWYASRTRSLLGAFVAGVAATKLLSFWDTLTKGEAPLILQADNYLPFLSLLVGFLVTFAVFFTVRRRPVPVAEDRKRSAYN